MWNDERLDDALSCSHPFTIGHPTGTEAVGEMVALCFKRF
jgi:hypothetical protein